MSDWTITIKVKDATQDEAVELADELIEIALMGEVSVGATADVRAA